MSAHHEIDKIKTSFREFKKWHEYLTKSFVQFLFANLIVAIGWLASVFRLFADKSDFGVIKIISAASLILLTILANRMILGMIAKFIRFKLKKTGKNVVIELSELFRWNYIDFKISFDVMKYEDDVLDGKTKILILGNGIQNKIEIGSLGENEKRKNVEIPINNLLIEEAMKDCSTIIKITIMYYHVFTGIRDSCVMFITKKHLIDAGFEQASDPAGSAT